MSILMVYICLISSISRGSAFIFVFLATNKLGVMKLHVDSSGENWEPGGRNIGGQWPECVSRFYHLLVGLGQMKFSQPDFLTIECRLQQITLKELYGA